MKPTKVELPEALKADVPHTTWGRILAATPVVMAVVATMLAGLSSSEMTRAQYERSMAAQRQSKAGDQWSFFQAKRLRGAIQKNTVDLLGAVTRLRPFDIASLQSSGGPAAASLSALSPDQQAGVARIEKEVQSLLESPSGRQALACVSKGELPSLGTPPPAMDSPVKAALDGLESGVTDGEMAALLANVSDKALEASLRTARDQAQALDAATKPVNQAIDQLDILLSRRAALLTAGSGKTPATAPADAAFPPADSTDRAFTVARLRYAALRYEAEARLNQGIANLFELQVRKSNISAERHHARSQRFFYGMLGAQLGVIISTFAIAARKRNLLWSLAAGAGLLAIAFAVYVYLYI
jgi:hypothetical protein